MKKRLLTLLLAGIIVLYPVSISASHIELKDQNVTNTYVSGIKKSCVSETQAESKEYVLVGIKGTYYTETKEKILKKINNIRYEACKEGVLNPNTGKKLKESDYVPIKWSSDLEEIARIRAAEATVLMDHVRPNGEICFSCPSSRGVNTWAESLAWNYSGLMEGIEQWYGEKKDWVSQNKYAVTGHYTALISPKYKYIGLGTFRQESGGWYAVSAEFSFETGLEETKSTKKGLCIQPISVLLESISDVEISNCSDMKEKESKTLALIASIGSSSKGKILSNVTWTSSDPTVASISENGKIKAISSGKTTIIASVGGKISARKTINVNHDWNTKITKAKLGMDGSEITKCSVCGQVKKKAIIYSPKTVTLSNTSYTYDGQVKKPTVTVKDAKGNKITSGNYSLVYSEGCKNVGPYKVTVKFKGSKYSGSIVKSFTINPKVTSLKSLSAVSKGFTVKWSKLTKQTTGYHLQYSLNNKFTKPENVYVKNSRTTSLKVKKLLSKKKYYVRIRTYKSVNGKKYYARWSKIKAVTTKK